MSGIFFFGVVAAWGAVAFYLAKRLARRVQPRFLGIGLGALAFVLLMVLPVADEIVGGYQFRALCRENAVLRIDAGKAKGRTVKEVIDPSNEILPRTAITIYHTRTSFRDIATNEEIANSDRYIAKGGWFIRMLGVSETNDPITFEPSYCPPSLGAYAIARKYGFTFIE
ncbi:MAG: hypothetical protein Q8O34_16470 [Rhodocyclaceae bacterium]|nr:hypothetical protein [Rhodocyclaceae bacterium]